jgi:hypothetical protein
MGARLDLYARRMAFVPSFNLKIYSTAMEFYELINKIQANMMEYYIKPVRYSTTMHTV